MNYHVSYGEHMLINAEEQPQPITTVLICQNTLLRTGISTILTGTAFALTQLASSDLSAFATDGSVLCLVCEDRVSEGAVVSVVRVFETACGLN
jgi:hypothetical protein